MILGHEIAFLATLAIGLALTGVLAGLIAGLLGVGGGIVSVPALFYLFGLLGVDDAARMHLAVGTSLALIVPTAISSAAAHRRRGAVDGALLRRWAPAMLVGVVLGTVLAGLVRGWVLTAVFAAVALVVAGSLVRGRRTPPGAVNRPGAPLTDLVAALIGTVSVMVGIGGGALSVPTMVAFGYPVHRAVGTAAAIGLIVALPGALGFVWLGLGDPGRTAFCLGYVHLPALAFMLPTATLTAPLGAGLAHRLNPRPLRLVFAAFLLLTAGRMLLDLAG